MKNKADFLKLCPEAYFLNLLDETGLLAYLKEQQWLGAEEKIVSLEKAGEGNMNCVLRVHSHKQKLILKQARPWVEKYPQIDAPLERNAMEKRFYDTANSCVELQGFLPQLKAYDAVSNILCFEDLGPARDFTFIYTQQQTLDNHHLEALLEFLHRLHAIKLKDTCLFQNHGMRKLNHAHIFEIPFAANNGVPLDSICPGLQQQAEAFYVDEELHDKLKALGAEYLSSSTGSLLHGDFFPGSWLNTEQGLKIIDPEFCFVGPVEFDWAVLLAHLVISGHGEQSVLSVMQTVDVGRVRSYAGVEILRRLLGYAQLPIKGSLAERVHLMKTARAMIGEPR